MKKYKVNIDRPKPSSEEILSHRDFDGLMKQYKTAPGKVVHKPFWKSGWFLGSMATAVLVVSAVVIYFNQENSVQKPSQKPQLVQVVNSQNDTSSIQNNSNPVNSFIPTKRKIAPPILGLNIQNRAYKFNSKTGATFTHTSGTKLTFPANAFVDATGNPVSGNVVIEYREFRDQADFFLSGIPMQYDSAQHTYQFVSAGMMEISGNVDGKPVYLANGKTVNVEFASKNAGTQFNLYKFDTLVGNWNYLGKDRVVLTPEQKNDSASLVEQALMGKGKPCGHINEFGMPVEPVKPLKADKRRNRFTIAINPQEFPEMKEYKDMIFEVDESRQKFNSEWYKITWESIKLSKTEKLNNYKIALARAREVVMLDVYPVFDDKDFEIEMEAYNVKFAAYQKNLDQFNQMIEQRKARENGIYDDGKGTIIKATSDGGFMYYTKPSPKDLEKVEEIMRCFTISGFGVYNLDALAELPLSIIALTINDINGKLFTDFATLYHVDRGQNGLFSYANRNPMTEFHFSPKSSNLIWAVKNGKLYYSDNDQFVKLPKSGGASIMLKAVDKEFKSPEEMKRFFKIVPAV